MKYMVDTFVPEEEKEVETVISVRCDAKLENVVRKAVIALMPILGLKKCRYNVDMPNVWRNGAVGTLTIDHKYFVGIRAEGHDAYIFLP